MKKFLFRRLSFCVLWSLVCSIALHAAPPYKVQLTVLEKGTRLPLISATVMFADNADFKQPHYAITDRSGKAIIDVPTGKPCHYRVSYSGFIAQSGLLDGSRRNLTLYLQEDAIGLENVVVTGSRSSRPVKLSPITTQVISGKAMVEAGYGNLQQVLQQETPGLNIQKVGFGNEISMQGLDARHVLFLMDGERMTGDMAGNLDYERFNLHAIDRIEIVKGASSTLYGSRASGAVINLITKKPLQPLIIDAGVRYGQMNERNYRKPHPKDFLYMFEKHADYPNLQAWVSAGGRAGAVSSQTDVWYSQSDAFYLYQKENDRKVYTRQANPFLDEDIVIESRLARPPMGIEGTQHLSASQKLYYEPSDRFRMQAYGTAFWMNQFDMVQDLVFTQSRDYTVGAKATYSLDNYFTVTASLHTDFYDRFKRHERRDEQRKVYMSRILQPRLTITSKYFKGHDLIFGIEHFTDELTSDRFVNRKMTSRALKETEYFFQDEWQITPRWMVSSGIRTNFSRQFGFMWMPKVAVKFSPNKQWSLRANYSRGYRSPSIKELFFNWDHLGMFMIKGNEYLKPETNNYVSLGAEYSDNLIFINTTLYGNFFRKKIEGVWRIYDMQYNFEYTNLGYQNLIGAEVLTRWKLGAGFSLNASYSYVNVSLQDGIRINSTSPHAATGGLEYRLRRPKYQLTGSFTTSIMGKKSFDVQDRVYVEKEGRSRDAYFRCTLPTYALCNVSVSQTFYNKVRLTMGVDNVFNYKPSTLGAGLTAFNIPATTGARAHVQLEFKINEFIDQLIRKK